MSDDKNDAIFSITSDGVNSIPTLLKKLRNKNRKFRSIAVVISHEFAERNTGF